MKKKGKERGREGEIKKGQRERDSTKVCSSNEEYRRRRSRKRMKARYEVCEKRVEM